MRRCVMLSLAWAILIGSVGVILWAQGNLMDAELAAQDYSLGSPIDRQTSLLIQQENRRRRESAARSFQWPAAACGVIALIYLVASPRKSDDQPSQE